MTFEEAISSLERENFYIITLSHRVGFEKFQILLGKGGDIYRGRGDSIMECLNDAVDNYAAGETYPDRETRSRVAASLYVKGSRVEVEGLDEKMKEMGWDLT